jgi:hypothetical protein
MSPSSKQLRPQATYAEVVDDEDFDFGDPDVVSVEVYPGKFLSLREPSADDLIAIEKVSNDTKLDEIEQSLAVICILHQPDEGKRKLSMRDAKRLRSKQIRKLSEAIEGLMGLRDVPSNGEQANEI